MSDFYRHSDEYDPEPDFRERHADSYEFVRRHGEEEGTGPVIIFGDNTDTTTLAAVFGNLAGCVLGVNDKDIHLVSVGTTKQGMWAFIVRDIDETFDPIGDEYTIAFHTIKKVVIY